MRIFFIILKQELILSFRNLGRILANFLFFLISFTIFFMMLQSQDWSANVSSFASIIIWFSLISCLIFSATDFLKKDFEDGTIEQALIICNNFEIFIFAKMLGNWLIYSLPILIAMPLVAFLSSINQEMMTSFLILALLASLAINFIATFCGSLSLLGNSAPMIALIAMPLIIPIILIANSGISVEYFAASCKILAGLVILSGAVSTLATTKAVKIMAD